MFDNSYDDRHKGEVDVAKYQSVLEAGPWFGAIEPTLRTSILHKLRVRSFPDEGCIYRLGDPPDGLYAVLEGEVRIIAYPHSSRPFITRILRSGDWFGSMGLCHGGPHSNEAVAFEQAVVAIFSLHDIETIAKDAPLWREIARLNGREHRFAADFVMSMLGASPLDRLAVLLRLGSAAGDDGARTLKITQEDLAAVAGLSRQRLNSILNQLEAAGRIERGYGVIRVLDETLTTHPTDEP